MAPNDNVVPVPGMPVAPKVGVDAVAGASPEVASPVAGDAVSREQFDQWKEEFKREQERNVGRLTSTLQRDKAEALTLERQRQAELEERLHEANVKGMDEAQRIQYERDRYADEAQQYRQKYEEAQAAAELSGQMGTVAQGFVALGVPFDKLNFSGMEDLYRSGWEGVANTQASMRQELETLRKGGQATPPVAPVTPTGPARPPVQAPRVVTERGGGPPPAVTSLEDIRKSLSDELGRPVSWEEFFQRAERNRQFGDRVKEFIDAQNKQSA